VLAVKETPMQELDAAGLPQNPKSKGDVVIVARRGFWN
jgi:hypothetical protein